MRFQRTVKKAVALEGKGLHSGEHVRVEIKNAPVDTGIIFIRTDLKGRPDIAAAVSNLTADSGSLRCTSIEKNGASVHTIEHLMAALGGLGIDNAEIEVNNSELPALDGSALDFARELKKAGILEQKKKKKELILKDAVSCHEGESSLTAAPAGNFSVSYLMKYDKSGHMAQRADFSFAGAGGDIFVKEIAPARTYCLEDEVADIMKRGLGKGGNYKNALVIKDGKPIKNKFRFPNEPVRHKVLDLLGDLALINAELKAHITGVKSGHSLNVKLLRKLEEVLHE